LISYPFLEIEIKVIYTKSPSDFFDGNDLSLCLVVTFHPPPQPTTHINARHILTLLSFSAPCGLSVWGQFLVEINLSNPSHEANLRGQRQNLRVAGPGSSRGGWPTLPRERRGKGSSSLSTTGPTIISKWLWISFNNHNIILTSWCLRKI